MKNIKKLLFSMLCLSMITGYCMPIFANEESLSTEQENVEKIQKEDVEEAKEETTTEETTVPEEEQTVEEIKPVTEENLQTQESDVQKEMETSFKVMYVLHDENTFLENSRIMYKTFTTKDFPSYDDSKYINGSYDDLYELADFVEKYAPKGYTTHNSCGSSGGRNRPIRLSKDLYRIDMKAYGVSGCTPIEGEIVGVDFIDQDTNSKVVGYSTQIDVEKDAKTFDSSIIDCVPTGYVIVEGEYEIKTDYSGPDAQNVGKFANVFVRKGTPDPDITFNFIENQDGVMKKVGSTSVAASKLSIVGDKLSYEAIKPYVLDGYRLYDGYDLQNYIAIDAYGENYTWLHPFFEIMVQKDDSDVNVEGPSIDENDMKQPSIGLDVTPEVEDILENSCDQVLKDKIEAALAAGKTISYKIESTTDKISDEDITLISDYMREKGYTGIRCFDIGISVVTNDGEVLGKITETSKPLTFEFRVPDHLKKIYSKFHMLRVHDGKVAELEVTENGNFVFSSNCFSTYEIAGSGEKSSEETKPETKPIDKAESSNDSKKENQKKNDVNTATETMSTSLMVMMVSSLAILLVAGIKKMRQE